MKAAVFNAFGGPEVLEVAEVETPIPAEGQIRVRVKAAGVQAYDCAVRGGWTPPGATLEFPQKVGNDFAGVVDELGEGVDAFAVGDEVLGWAILSCYAEYLVVSVDQVVAKPANMPWEVAGAFSASAQTAHTALEDLAVGAGDTLLVHAAAGGVGTIAVQLAKERGATVIGTASERNHDYLRELGATPVRYGEGLVERVRALAPQGVTAALDGIGGVAVDDSVELVKDKDRIGTLVAFERLEELGVRGIFSRRAQGRLAELTALYAAGKLRVEISRTFPLERAADAHREVETGHVRGKVVVTVA
ncbi:NADP-dependent oxidoreductase [Streptomyces sp. NPDC054904]|uniref:NADP-dependent oxidoreductase n=1 Tax=unclassified Streptomyces TaxID=2593676 RepID=UPI002481B150|nr:MULTISPECIES: NADP-dependent oxidoreductase [unclassified Streptomyces]MDA5283019.1 NADP-dependent oxidoreductase [Streptomyces sp. Isolate_45]MDX2394222.1 NADP-dependent oxidoreductase [Streptomyces sp. DK15]